MVYNWHFFMTFQILVRRYQKRCGKGKPEQKESYDNSAFFFLKKGNIYQFLSKVTFVSCH